MFYSDKSVAESLMNTPGLGAHSKKLILLRFEILSRNTRFLKLLEVENTFNRRVIMPLNIIFSQINSVNNNILALKKLKIARMYLVKSYKGRCHAIGKPVNGQRTWSNAWGSYNTNKVLRLFIAETKKQSKTLKKEEKINYRLTKKKYVTKKKSHTKIEKKQRIWY